MIVMICNDKIMNNPYNLRSMFFHV